LNTGFFLASRLFSHIRGNFSWTFVVIAITSIALGISIMIIAVAILTGFKKEIREKVVGFTGHILVTKFSPNNEFEPQPIEKNQPFLPALRQDERIRHIQAFATKAGIIKTREHIQGVILKGVGTDYDWNFFKDKMAEGRTFTVSDTGKTDEAIISRKTATQLGLHLHDDLRMYFISGSNTLGRKFSIAGIYDTGLEEFDKLYVICDLRHIQKLNNWSPDQVSGFEVHLMRFEDTDRMGAHVYRQIGFSLDASTVRMLNQQIFDWLDLQDINVLILLILIILVSSSTIISTLLILILERTTMIGILKALGMPNRGIRTVFIYLAFYIAGWGMAWGNLAGLALCFLQKKFSLVTLSEESYFVSVIPINLDLWNILLINAGAVVLCYLVFLIPVMIVSRVAPVRAIRFS